MRRSTRFITGAAALLALAGLGAYLERGAIAERLFARGVNATLGADAIAALPDGLHVALCGAGSPLPDPHRAGPCVAVIAGRALYIVDIGDGATRNLGLMGLNPGRVTAVLLTHFHSDHIDGLGGLLLQHWGNATATTRLPVYGPPGVESVVAGFNAAYVLDTGYRVAHHGPVVMPPGGAGGMAMPFATVAGGPSAVIVDTADLKITAFAVNHTPVSPAVGYRFAYKGRVVVISGDTAPSPRVEAEAKHADLLVHEALSPALVKTMHDAAVAAGRTNLGRILADIPGYHTTPTQAADIAARAHVQMLLLDHIVPGLPFKALEIPFVGDARSHFSGTLLVGHDGDMVSLPAGSDRVEVSNRLRR